MWIKTLIVSGLILSGMTFVSGKSATPPALLRGFVQNVSQTGDDFKLEYYPPGKSLEKAHVWINVMPYTQFDKTSSLHELEIGTEVLVLGEPDLQTGE